MPAPDTFSAHGASVGIHSWPPWKPIKAVATFLLEPEFTGHFLWTFAWPFADGEIPTWPALRVDGVPIAEQQATILRQYKSGAIAHARFDVRLPVAAGLPMRVTVHDGPKAHEWVNDELPDVEAVAHIGTTAVSCSDLAAAWHPTWVNGPVATQWIVADSMGGFDVHGTLIAFHVTKWHVSGETQVRFIGERSRTDNISDASYDLRLELYGSTKYTRNALLHTARSAWTRKHWALGAQPSSAVHVLYDVDHLIRQRIIPPYRWTRISKAHRDALAAKWAAVTARDLYDSGGWQKGMPTGGSRADIGPYTTWQTHWLFSGDWRLRERVLTMADLASAWPMRIREQDPARSGFGGPVRLTDRPTLWADTARLAFYASGVNEPADRLNVTGPVTTAGWTADNAHQPDPYWLPYLLTGDPYYAEGGAFWASWTAAGIQNPRLRGPNGGALSDSQVRGQAWAFRSRVRAASFLPDRDSSLRNYFERLTQSGLAVWEGTRDIQGPYADPAHPYHADWAWGRSTAGMKEAWEVINRPNPLRAWNNGSSKPADTDGKLLSASVLTATPVYTNAFLALALGHAKDLGYDTSRLLSWFAPFFLQPFTDLYACPFFFLVRQHSPVIKTDRSWFLTWREVAEQGFSTARPDGTPHTCLTVADELRKENTDAPVNFGNGTTDNIYQFVIAAALAYLDGEPGIEQARAFMEQHIWSDPAVIKKFADNPKWNIRDL